MTTPREAIRQQEHELKTWPEFFGEVESGRKKHEIRKFDRDYRVGDVLTLREWEPGAANYTGREFRVRVTYMTQAFLPPDLVAMSIEPESATPPPPSAEGLRTLVGQLRTDAVQAYVNADDSKIPPLDRRQCFGVAQAYSYCADRIEAALGQADARAPEPICVCGHAQSNHPFGLSENLICTGRCIGCACEAFAPALHSSPSDGTPEDR